MNRVYKNKEVAKGAFETTSVQEELYLHHWSLRNHSGTFSFTKIFKEELKYLALLWFDCHNHLVYYLVWPSMTSPYLMTLNISIEIRNDLCMWSQCWCVCNVITLRQKFNICPKLGEGLCAQTCIHHRCLHIAWGCGEI